MFRIALRTVVANRVRLVLTALSAILGVAFITGMLMLTTSLDRTFTGIFEGTAQDVEITRLSALDSPETFADEGDPDSFATAQYIPDSVVSDVATIDGVSAVSGTASGPGVYVLDASGDVVGSGGPPSLGITWLSDPELALARIVEGREPSAADEIVVDALTFPGLGVQIGSEVELLLPQGRSTASLVGVFELGESGGLAGVSLTALVPGEAQRQLTAPGFWSSVVVAVGSGRTDADVAADIRELLGEGYEVQTRAEQIEVATSALREGLGFFTTILSVFAGIALFVAAFLIYNTFSMLVAQRGRELALLRAVGAQRRQILGAVLVEAVLVALLSAVLGVALGYLLALGLKALLGVIGLQLSSGIALTGQAVLWAVVLGLVVTVASALIPAWRASRTSPVAAMRENGSPAQSAGKWRTLLGLLVLVPGVWGISRALAGDFDAAQTGISAAVLVIATILLAPALAKAFATMTTGILGIVAGVAGRIAGRNAARNPGRVAATATALMIGLTLVMGVTVLVASVKQSIDDLIDRTFVGDVLITMDSGRTFSPAIAEGVAEVPGVQLVLSQTVGPAELNGQGIRVIAIGGGNIDDVLGDALGGVSSADLFAGQAVATVGFAAEQGLAEGDDVELLLPSGARPVFRIAALVENNPLLSGLVLPLEDYRAAGGDPRDQALFVAFDGSVPAQQVVAGIEEVVAVNPLLTVLDQSQVKEQNAEQLNQLLYLVYAMLGLSVVIAALGVINTMALSVVERTREIGLLRAVGASRRQIRRMIRWEAILVSALGGALGVGVGVVVGAALRKSLEDEGIDVLVIPWDTAAIVFAAAILIGVLGAVIPARRASRLDILRAISAE